MLIVELGRAAPTTADQDDLGPNRRDAKGRLSADEREHDAGLRDARAADAQRLFLRRVVATHGETIAHEAGRFEGTTKNERGTTSADGGARVAQADIAMSTPRVLIVHIWHAR